MSKPPPDRSDIDGGQFVYRAPQPHACRPPSYANTGDVWRCNCGQHFLCGGVIPRIGGRRWQPTEWPQDH